MRLSSLEELGIGVSAEDVTAALKPFLADGPGYGEDRWRSEAATRRRRILKRVAQGLAGRWLGFGRRSTESVREEYDAAWAIGHARYDLSRRAPKFTPWLWRERHLLFDAAGAPRFRSLLYAAVIERLKPRRVLEVGCGDGINLLLLAGAFPEIAFTGLELTASGLAAAKGAQRSPELPDPLLRYAPLAQKDVAAFHRIAFIEGNATAMPFADAAFDLVLTALSVEQMERVRAEAFAEIARVSAGHVLNLEPFMEVNRSGLRRLNVVSRDYFRGSIGELTNYRLTPLWATADFPQEVYLGAALVLSRKQ